MTDNEIIKALECCSTDVRENTCPKCIFYKEHRCSTLMLNAASDLINRQKAQIEKLQHNCFGIQNELEAYKDTFNTAIDETKSEAIKEFAERLKSISIGLEIGDDKKFKMTVVSTVAIDKIAKEMTEVKENEK